MQFSFESKLASKRCEVLIEKGETSYGAYVLASRIVVIFLLLITFTLGALAQNDSVLIPGIRGKGDTTVKRLGLKFGFSSPNELNGYTFFKDGKASSLRLGVSTREDVTNIFGECTNVYGPSILVESCEYDSNWMVDFEYLDERHLSMGYVSLGSKGEIIDEEFVLSPDFARRIKSVILRPRKLVNFGSVQFSAVFTKTEGKKANQQPDRSFSLATYNLYEDRYGLAYQVFESEKLIDGSIRYGDPQHYLMSIKYSIPAELENSMFVKK